MIRKLRYKFMAVTMSCISLLFILILLVISISMTFSAKRQGYSILERIAFPPALDLPVETPANMPFSPVVPPADNYQDKLRIFSVSFDENGIGDYMDFNERSDLTEEKIQNLGQKAYAEYQKTQRDKGALSTYLYQVANNGKIRIYFLDYTVEKSFMGQLFNLCLFAGLFGILILFISVWLLSGWMVKPVQISFEKQKQFIADASHELKTPLTIINANAEVLAALHPGSNWIKNILDQSSRMNTLIKDLLELARIDAYTSKEPHISFDLSRCVSSVSLSFESIAYETQKKYDIQIAEHLSFKGNEEQIRQLTTILLDNAFKYSDEKGAISITLAQKNDKRGYSVLRLQQEMCIDEAYGINPLGYIEDINNIDDVNKLDKKMIDQNISFGGCADILICALFIKIIQKSFNLKI